MAHIKHNLRRFIKHEQGSQLIELAFSVPFLLLMFAGTAEIGRLFFTYSTMAKGTRAAVRYLSTADLTQSGAAASQNTAKNIVVCGSPDCGTGNNAKPALVANLTNDKVQITFPATGGVSYAKVEIVGYTYEPFAFDVEAMTNSENGSMLRVPLAPSTQMRVMQ